MSTRRAIRESDLPASHPGARGKLKLRQHDVGAGAVPPAELQAGFPPIDLPIRPPFPPMEARVVKEIPAGDNWIYDPSGRTSTSARGAANSFGTLLCCQQLKSTLQREPSMRKKKESFATSAVWRTRLPKVKFAVSPGFGPRPNPLIIGSKVFVSVFAPGAVCALNARTGALVWRRELLPYGAASVYLASGTLFAKSSHNLYALDPNSGEELWNFCPYGTDGEWIYSNPVASGSRLFIGDRCGILHCLNAKSGKSIWSVRTNNNKNNKDVNSTPVVVAGLVIVGTNAGVVVAYDVASGKRAWKRNVGTPAAFDVFMHLGLVAVQADALYLLAAKSGAVEQVFRWRGDAPAYSASLGRNLAVIMRGAFPPSGVQKMFIYTPPGDVVETEHRIWTPTLRYAPETRLGYLSHLQGVRLIRPGGEVVGDILGGGGEGVGLVDVKSNVIYTFTNRGYVYALRHPTTN